MTKLDLTSDPDDHERAPDGIPHDVVWRTVFVSCALAAVALASVSATGPVTTACTAALALPFIVLALVRRSTRERDHVHPSR